MKYFLHDTSSFDDEKITELFIKFGYEGLGLFYTALEKIARQEKPIKTDVLKTQLRVGKRLNKCWEFMEEIGLLSSMNGETFNEKLLNFSEKYQINKEKNREKVAKWRENQTNKENVTSNEPDCNDYKVKESKVKESKVKEDYIDKIVNVFAQTYQSVFDLEYVITNKGKERSAAGKLADIYRKKYPEANTEESIESFRVYFDACCKIQDDFYRDKISLPLILSQFNQINKILKHGNKKTIKSVADRSAEIDRIVDAVFESKQ